ncbi:MAG: 50S ribosomal protein L27 [Patescibacteria group bacterium]
MAHTKAKGTSKLGRDSRSKRLGVKIFSGQKVLSGQIIVRQRGSKYYIGTGVARADDDTIYAKKDGSVSFSNKKVRRFSGRLDKKVIVNVA